MCAGAKAQAGPITSSLWRSREGLQFFALGIWLAQKLLISKLLIAQLKNTWKGYFLVIASSYKPSQVSRGFLSRTLPQHSMRMPALVLQYSRPLPKQAALHPTLNSRCCPQSEGKSRRGCKPLCVCSDRGISPMRWSCPPCLLVGCSLS